MSFGSRLKERREELGLKQSDLGKLLGITGSAVGNYENGVSSPKADILYRVFDVLKCDANFLFQDEMKELETDSFSMSEVKIIKKYRSLNKDGQDFVNLVLDREYDRCQSLPDQTQEEREEYKKYSSANQEVHESKVSYLTPVAAHNDNPSEEQIELMNKDLEDL